MKYTVVVSEDEGGGYSASVPALPGCHTWGRTRSEAFRHAKDAVETYLDGLALLGEDAPREVEARPIVVAS